MTQEQEHLAGLTDPKIPSMNILLGSEAPVLLNAVMSHLDGRVIAARPSQIRYSPSRLLVVQYRASLEWGDRSASEESLVASVGLSVPDHIPQVDTGDSRVAVWRYPHDPFLPGLALAASPDKTAEVLRILGAPEQSVRLRRRAYRPGRRAVIEVVAPNTRIYLKVVQPGEVADLQANHKTLVDHVPIPHSHGWSKDLGLVALQALPGKPMRRPLESGSRRLPAPSQVIDLLEMLADAPRPSNHLKAPTRRAATHATLLGTVIPHLRDRLAAIVESVESVDLSHDTVVHGDFHSSQILTKGKSITGLIDVDTVGMGSRPDDLATLLGHISSLALNSASGRSMDRYGRQLIAAFDQTTNPRDLRLRTAAVVLGFATGPFRVQQKRWVQQTERRVALAEKWVKAASEVP
jgi:hypothetical protein